MSISTNELLMHLDELHTTELGALRIQRNLGIEEVDIIAWCKAKISAKQACIKKVGKNWYVSSDGCRFTIHATSYTIITAHKQAQ